MSSTMKDLWEQILESDDLENINVCTKNSISIPQLSIKTNINTVLCPICNRTVCKLIYEDMDEHNKQHMREIIPNLFLGSKGNAYNSSEIQYFKINNIVNAAYEIQNKFINTIEYKNFQWNDVEDFNILQDLDIVTEYIHKLLTCKKNVFVHCYAGRSRSASIIIAYLIAFYDKTYEEAYKIVKGIKDDICPNPGFIEQLKIFEKNCELKKEKPT